MDQAICSGNYFDYPDDEIALQRELEIGDSISENYIDESFPPNSRSLYFDPLNPPKGGLPNDSIKWFSISEREVLQCDQPIFFNEDMYSCRIKQGALGDAYFIHTLALLSCQPKFINRLLVSSRFAAKGLYTLKFYKNGKWRYVHIDDYIPCRQSGKVHFSRNVTPNETFAMLVEKAYAKLHGCYEALTYGLIEKLLHDLTPAAGINTLRVDTIPKRTVCDDIWDTMDKAVSRNALIGCGRFVADPMAENPAIRQGITLGALYHVMDMCVTSAEPTEDFDAITVGMVCVRTLLAHSTRFTGRWSYGHQLWFNYKEIALDLRQRTREIQFKRGLGPNPNVDDFDAQFESMNTKQALERDFAMTTTTGLNTEGEDKDDENDDLDLNYHEQIAATKIVQPLAEDLQWMQIEDFVEIFNRVFIIQDMSFEKRTVHKRFASQWLPGDYLVGSGGPPVIVTKEIIEPEEQHEDHSTVRSHDDNTGMDIHSQTQSSPRTIAPPKVALPPIVKRTAMINESFTDNPMYPITVTEPTRVNITLFQCDKRWNVGRLGEDARAVNVATFVSRHKRLESVMDYPIGIGFLVMRLSGLKLRVTEFRLKKVAYVSEYLSFSSSVSAVIDLFPGRYAIIPYTHTILDRAMDYALHCQCTAGHIDFEIEDAIAQRLQDKDASVGEDDEAEPEDNDLLRTHEHDDDVSVLSFEKVTAVENEDDLDDDDEDDERSNVEGRQRMVPLPKIFKYHRWEFAESTEELGLQCMYGEVGDMMTFLKTLKGEVDRLNSSLRQLTKGQQQQSDNQDN